MKKLFVILLASSAAASAAASAQGSASGTERKAASHDVHELEKRNGGRADEDCDGATGGEAQRHAIRTKGTGASGRTETQETAGKYSAPINIDRGIASARGGGPAVPPSDAVTAGKAAHDTAMSCPRNLR